MPPARLRPPSPAPNRGEVWGPCSQPGRGPARPSGLGCQEGGPRRSRAGSGRGGRGAGAPRPRLRRALLRGGIIEPRGRGPALAAEARLELGARAARVPRPEPRAAPRAPRLCPPAARCPPPMERAAPSRRVPLPLLLLGGLSLLAAQGRGAGARRGGRERPEPTAPALVTPRHPDRPDPRPVRLLELPAPGSVDRRCAPPRSSRCLCCAAARPRRRSRQPPTRLLASVPITSLTWEFVLKTDGSLQTHPPAGPLASTLPTLAPTHPLGPGCGLGERKAGWWLPRTPPTHTLHHPVPAPCTWSAPGIPVPTAPTSTPAQALWYPACWAVGTVICPRDKSSHGVGGGYEESREEGSGLKVFRAMAVCAETPTCPPETPRTPRHGVLPGSKLSCGWGQATSKPSHLVAEGCQGGLHQQTRGPELPALGLTALGWQAPGSSFLP